VIRRDLNIIKTYYGDILGHAKIRIAQRANHANCCDIVQRNDGGECPAVLQQFLNERVTKFWRG
jgi:hypothetical protein